MAKRDEEVTTIDRDEMANMQTVNGTNTKTIRVDGVDYLNFSGSSYLDLSGNDEMCEAAISSLKQYGLANDLGYRTAGHPIISVEKAAASFFGTEAALYCSSAYIAALIVVTHLAKNANLIILDEHAHFSLTHAAKITGLRTVNFAHCSAEGLGKTLKENVCPGEVPLLISDGVFPTWGKIAPVQDYVPLIENYGGKIFIDDAHGTGALGHWGRGTIEHAQVTSSAVVYGAGLSKALGTQGGVIPGSTGFVEELRNTNAVYAAISLPTMPTVAATIKSFEIAKDPERRKRLWENAKMLKEGLAALGLPVSDTVMPIATLTTGDAVRNAQIHSSLRKNGIWNTLSTYVGAPEERAIRNAVYATHSSQEINFLLETYRRYL